MSVFDLRKRPSPSSHESRLVLTPVCEQLQIAKQVETAFKGLGLMSGLGSFLILTQSLLSKTNTGIETEFPGF